MKIINTILVSIFLLSSCAKKIIATPAVMPQVISTMDKPSSAFPMHEMEMAGNATYIAKCGRYHALKAVDNYTAFNWTSIIDRMVPKAKLDSTEKANVLAYVHANAKK